MSLLNKKIAALFFSLLALASTAFADVKIGTPFPDLGTFNLEGTLPDTAGRVVMVDFWATWCSPCKASFPAYSTMQKDLADRGFTLIAVSVDKKPEEYAAFLKKFAPGFVTVRDGAQKLVATVKVPGMPTCYLIDRKGVLREIHTGYHGDASVKELRAKIQKLLEEQP
ncbi:MAG: TlpA disulfide reductase family protein [Nibricoccus sp.]